MKKLPGWVTLALVILIIAIIGMNYKKESIVCNSAVNGQYHCSSTNNWIYKCGYGGAFYSWTHDGSFSPNTCTNGCIDDNAHTTAAGTCSSTACTNPSTWTTSATECCGTKPIGCQDKRCVATVDDCGTCKAYMSSCAQTSECCTDQGLSCINYKCNYPSGDYCTETDNGNDMYHYGVRTVSSGGFTWTDEDECTAGGDVIEYFCHANGVDSGQATMDCPDGCSSGACILEQCNCEQTANQCAGTSFPDSCGNANACLGDKFCGSGYHCVDNGANADTCEPNAPSTCSDGTARSTCSTLAPYYCNSNLLLTEECWMCGCPAGKGCDVSGECIYVDSCTNGNIQNCMSGLCQGKQTCIGGEWGSCVLDNPSCNPNPPTIYNCSCSAKTYGDCINNTKLWTRTCTGNNCTGQATSGSDPCGLKDSSSCELFQTFNDEKNKCEYPTIFLIGAGLMMFVVMLKLVKKKK